MTEIFSDGFETGNFNAWTGTSGTPEVVEDPVHHGGYAAKFNANGEYIYKNFETSSTVNCRLYFQFNTLPSGSSQYFSIALLYSPEIWTLYYGTDASGALRFTFWRSYPSGAGIYIPYTLSVNTWYCIEIEFVKAASPDGKYLLYLDGEYIGGETGLDTSSATPTQVRIGTGITNYQVNLICDCVVVADAYIGEEGAAEGQPYVSRVQQISGMQTFNPIHLLKVKPRKLI